MMLIISIIFSVMILSMIIPVSALQQSAGSMIYELELGSTQTLKWTLISDSSDDMVLHMSTSGEGSELLSFPSELELPSKRARSISITVTIPDNFDDNIILKPKVIALAKGVADSGATVINIAMSKTLQIHIGENPIAKEVKEQPAVVTPKPEVVVDPKPTEKSYPKSQMVIGGGETKQVSVDEPKAVYVEEPQMISEPKVECGKGAKVVDGYCKVINSENEDGGCLIATATYGTELAPQVQQLRELRDNSLLTTESGTAFMTAFNTVYYSFAPSIADMERENPVFREMIKVAITPMISSLSILNYVDMDSENSVLGYGISLIVLNVGMYFVAPAIVIIGIIKKNTQKIQSHTILKKITTYSIWIQIILGNTRVSKICHL